MSNPLAEITPIDAATDDARWFAANSRRAHRVRRAYPGEVEQMCSRRQGLDDIVHYITVRQIAPGVRVRLGSTWSPGTALPNTEEFGHALFDIQRVAPDGAVVTVDEVASFARMYRAEGAVS